MLKKWSIIAIALLIAWFIPWVFAFYLGVVVYFPYEPNGKDRFIRATGPILKWIDKDASWVSGDELPKSCRAALVAAEDGRFYDHYGLDPEGIERAYEKNQKRKNRRLVGGSTITQQLVKNVFLSRHKSYLRKAREALGALILDRIMSKNGQITWYFNVVEFGPKIYGLKAAAKYYFGKKPTQLSVSDCTLLVSVLRDPKHSYQSLKRQPIGDSILRRQQSIMRTMAQLGAKTP